MSNAGSFQVSHIDWDSSEGDAVRAIRLRVFVDEQGVPPELELDETDASCLHLLAYDDAGMVCGTGRLYDEPGEQGTGHIGRMAVLPHARRRGCGAAILKGLMEHGKQLGYSRIVLTAQTHAVGFYEKFGFKAFGDEFMDAGIPHRWMEISQ